MQLNVSEVNLFLQQLEKFKKLLSTMSEETLMALQKITNNKQKTCNDRKPSDFGCNNYTEYEKNRLCDPKSNRIFVQILIGTRKCLALIDSGSENSIVNEPIARFCQLNGWQSKQEERLLIVSDGMRKVEQMMTGDITFKGQTTRVTFHVLESLGFDVLLGMDVLENLGLNISLLGEKLYPLPHEMISQGNTVVKQESPSAEPPEVPLPVPPVLPGEDKPSEKPVLNEERYSDSDDAWSFGSIFDEDKWSTDYPSDEEMRLMEAQNTFDTQRDQRTQLIYHESRISSEIGTIPNSDNTVEDALRNKLQSLSRAPCRRKDQRMEDSKTRAAHHQKQFTKIEKRHIPRSGKSHMKGAVWLPNILQQSLIPNPLFNIPTSLPSTAMTKFGIDNQRSLLPNSSTLSRNDNVGKVPPVNNDNQTQLSIESKKELLPLPGPNQLEKPPPVINTDRVEEQTGPAKPINVSQVNQSSDVVTRIATLSVVLPDGYTVEVPKGRKKYTVFYGKWKRILRFNGSTGEVRLIGERRDVA